MFKEIFSFYSSVICKDNEHICTVKGVKVCVKDSDDPKKDCHCLLTEIDSIQDFDKDYVHNRCDNCLKISNGDQMDTDSDSIGDACDNCPSKSNRDQSNEDGDQYGDVCDPHFDTGPFLSEVVEQELDDNKKNIATAIVERLLELYYSK